MVKCRKSISVFLLAALVLAFSSCTGTSKTDTKKTAAETTVPQVTEQEGTYEPLELPENLDFGAMKIRIITTETNEGDDNPYVSELTVEELRNEPINDAVYNREIYVEELLNVDIERVQIESNSIQNYLIDQTMAGNDPGEIAAVSSQAGIWQADDDIFRDLAGNEYINTSAPWWLEDYTAASSIGNHYFSVTGDLSLSLKRCLFITFFNKTLAENNGIGDVYQTVFDGKWTLDCLSELSSKVYQDLNGNSEADIEDCYGLIISETSVDPFWTAFDIDIFRKDENNYVEYVLDKEKFGIAVDKVDALFAAKTTNNIGWSEDLIYTYFAQDMGLFAITRMYKVETEIMRNMQSEYGILPLPKFDEAQEGYYTMPSDRYTAFALPVMNQNYEAASAVLEAMAWYSYRYVTPAYLDIAMKGKYANDQPTRNMLDLIIAGFHVDTGWLASKKLYEFPQMWRFIVTKQITSWSSDFAKKERKIGILVREYNTFFDKYD